VQTWIWRLGVGSGLWLLLVGMLLAPFLGAGLAQRMEIAGPWAAPLVVLLLLGVIALHAIPFILILMFHDAQSRKKWLGGVMLLASPFTAWPGIDGLLIRVDLGDAVMWAPYLLSGICLAALGFALISKGSSGGSRDDRNDRIE
jgi:hypothetical protein